MEHDIDSCQNLKPNPELNLRVVVCENNLKISGGGELWIDIRNSTIRKLQKKIHLDLILENLTFHYQEGFALQSLQTRVYPPSWRIFMREYNMKSSSNVWKKNRRYLTPTKHPTLSVHQGHLCSGHHTNNLTYMHTIGRAPDFTRPFLLHCPALHIHRESHHIRVLITSSYTATHWSKSRRIL